MNVRIERLEMADILAADEIFIGNSIAGLWRVARLDDRHWITAGWTEQFKQWIHETD
jgi:4-amino-4-deoxychorismate lyase